MSKRNKKEEPKTTPREMRATVINCRRKNRPGEVVGSRSFLVTPQVVYHLRSDGTITEAFPAESYRAGLKYAMVRAVDDIVGTVCSSEIEVQGYYDKTKVFLEEGE